MTTTGRRTGRPHEIEIWFGAHEGRVYLLSGGGDRSDWVRNIRADPRVHMRVGNRSWAGLARLLGDDDGVARRLLAAKYQGWREGEPMSKWAQSALLIEIEPTASPEQL